MEAASNVTVAAPSPEEGSGIPKQTKDSLDSTPSTPTKPDAAPETQPHFESRGNLDTLVAAALKPLAEEYPQRHHSSPQRYEPPSHSHSNHYSSNDNSNIHTNSSNESSNNNNSANDRNHRTNTTQHISSYHSGSPSRSPRPVDSSYNATGGSGLDPNSVQTATSSVTTAATTTATTHSIHHHSSSKYHYREQGRTLSDEDSAEEDPLSTSRQKSRHAPPDSSSEYPTSGLAPSLQEQPDSAFKLSARSSMSISSLLGDSTGYARRKVEEEDSTPEHHATTRHLTPSPVRLNGAQSEGLFEQRCAERVVNQRDNCPRRQSNARDEYESHDDMDQDHLPCEPHPHYHHHNRTHSHPHLHPHPIHNHYHHRNLEDQAGTTLPEVAKQPGFHHHHQSQDLTLGDAGARHHHHHRHIPHPHPHHPMAAHSHNHPHAHRHAQHPGLFQHGALPHRHHHHIHHHHLHIEKSTSSVPSAFHYVPRSAGLSLNPRLKVNATQVYISYLIQLDQMQRAQHLKRSSEKRKSTGDMFNGLAGSPTSQRPPHARTPSGEEPSRSAQVVPHPEEVVERERDDRAYSPGVTGSPEDRKRRSSYKMDGTDAAVSIDNGSAAPMAVDPSSPVSSTTARPRQSHGHLHPHSHPHNSQHQHAHPHPHPHPPHGHQHSAPVLPAHVHPAQHHHHIVPLTVRGDKGPVSAAATAASAKANHSQTVHRHHALHHHHPHHHPYHPNHPNHQHHFHHHGHPATHGHGHGHVHGHGHGHGHAHGHGHPYHGHGHVHHNHVHNHGNHLHTHGHGHSPSRQRSPIVDRISRDSATPPINHMPHAVQPIPHPSLAAPSSSPNPTTAVATPPGVGLAPSENEGHSSHPLEARLDRGGEISPGQGAKESDHDGQQSMGSGPKLIKDVTIEMEESSLAPPPPPPTAATTATSTGDCDVD